MGYGWGDVKYGEKYKSKTLEMMGAYSLVFRSLLGAFMGLMGGARWRKRIYISLRFSIALEIVISSKYSKSPPTGIPWAILVTLTPKGFISLEI